MFKLSRSGKNVIAEVQRWQYFLLSNGVTQVGKLDGQFGANTESGTKIFQLQHGLSVNGRADENTLKMATELGYVILKKDYYEKRSSKNWPKKPSGLTSPDSDWNNDNIGCFKFRKTTKKGNPHIVVKGSCDGKSADWEAANIVKYYDDRLRFADNYRGYIRCHKTAKPYIAELLDTWERESLLHLVLNYAGGYVPRYKKIKSNPPPGPHGTKMSRNVNRLSNHSYGSTLDISTTWNWIGDTPAVCGELGSVRELVPAANKIGFFWGGHYKSGKDGMHFELAKL
ncbi:MAG: M15 family metallopeptidase [Roseibium sp.]